MLDTCEQIPPRPEPVSTHCCCHHSIHTNQQSQPPCYSSDRLSNFCETQLRPNIQINSFTVIPSQSHMAVQNEDNCEVWGRRQVFKTMRSGLSLFGPRKNNFPKPKLVFGGTYPIDLPIGFRSKSVPTFDIDVPVPLNKSSKSSPTSTL